jgi:hypothetical protein
MQLRIFCTLFLLLSVCALPLYFTIAIGLFSVIWFRAYYELIPLYFLHDMLYGITLERLHGFTLVMTLCAVIAVAISIRLKREFFAI